MKPMNRQELLKGCARGGVLAGIVGLCAVLASREEKFVCSDRCGKCVKFENGKCGLGLK
ncbi:hypothetical protein [Pontiella sulfatireligans]|uniref:Uncharacterized protein n=1 Tax=Pontiella sulfatireligans TaxID=2750658 RepID=A0A6C2UP85_9BACT|nr:hypothetical protein [Pontiella sulfatireligans]VGO21753.1 hypothetical protein SCARR_03828 [Pontiella sulfatireligans]